MMMVMVVIMVMMMMVIEQSTPLTSYSYSSIIHDQQHREGEHQGHHHCLLVRRHPFHLEHLLLQEGEQAQSFILENICICVSLLCVLTHVCSYVCICVMPPFIK